MDRSYRYGPISVRVKSTPVGDAYIVSLENEQLTSSSLLIDAHYGADHASKFALETYDFALAEPKAFMARERLEASSSGPTAVSAAEEWAAAVIAEAKTFGSAIPEAIRASAISPIEDVSAQVEAYLELLEFSWQAEIETLLAEGFSQEAAEREISRRNLERSRKRWMFVPRLRAPRGMKR